jgi:hypothetical protein
VYSQVQGATLVGVPEEHGCGSGGELLELEIISRQHTVDRPLTEGLMEYKMVVYADESKCAHNCTVVYDPEMPVLHLSRQNEPVVQRDGGHMDGNELRCTHDTQTTNIVNIHTQCEAAEPQIDLPQGVAPYEPSIDPKTVCSISVAGRLKGVKGTVFGRGYKSGKGETENENESVRREVSSGLRDCQLAGQFVSE